MTASETPARPALDSFIAARSELSERAAASAGLERCHELSDLVDAALRELDRELGANGEGGVEGHALVATGGYGRREQARHSDIDLMILVDGSGDASEATRVLYPLWDARLEVGHSVRTPAQAMEAAQQNVETMTALLDTRLVAGDEALYGRFVTARRKLLRRPQRWMHRELSERRAALVEAEPWQLQSPDLKSGRGGLRDLQLVHWLATAEALAEGHEAPPPSEELREAHERLLATRNAVHALNERKTDVYRADLAARVAAWLHVDPSEWRRDVFIAMRVIDAAAASALEGRASRRRRPLLPWRRRREDRPSEAEGEPAGSDLGRLLRDLREVEAKAGRALEPLPATRWLERVLPEWEALRGLPHATLFHRHPVDVHSMRTVAEIDYAMRVDEEQTGTPAAAAGLSRDEVLLAAMLHDIGKGHEGDHSIVGAVIAERFASRVGLGADATRRLAAAAEHHLLLPIVATRRDIADPRVIREAAEAIGDTSTLHLVYLLAVADARATGPEVWNPWKAQLIRSLYERVLEVLSVGTPEAATAPEQRLSAIVEALAGRFTAEQVEAHVRGIEPGYLLSTPPATIGDHIELIEQLGDRPTAVRRDRLGDLDRLTVATRDRPGILQAVVGALAGHNADVLGGVAYTRDDGVAIQVWHPVDALSGGAAAEGGARSIDDRRWERILDAVPAAIAGEFAIDERLAEVRATYPMPVPVRRDAEVNVDNGASTDYSVVEVHTADRRGLLYAITRTLHELALDIHLAKVDTIGPQVVDAFYVQRRNGRRVENADEIERLERRVREAVLALDEAD